jgi:hypothetical protein
LNARSPENPAHNPLFTHEDDGLSLRLQPVTNPTSKNESQEDPYNITRSRIDSISEKQLLKNKSDEEEKTPLSPKIFLDSHNSGSSK